MSLPRVLVALALCCGLLMAAPAAARDADYGHVWRGNGVLHPGCHHYRFRYRVRPGNEQWSLELFLRGPRDEGLGTVAKDSDVDPTHGLAAFGMCRSTTSPGRFRIRGKLSIYEDDGIPPLVGPGEPDVKWIEPARFRLRRAG